MVLRNAVTALMKREGYGKGSPHELLPEGLKEKHFFKPKIEAPKSAEPLAHAEPKIN
jgi:hypothetical protein